MAIRLSDQVPDAEARLNASARALGARYRGCAGRWRLPRADALFDAGRYARRLLRIPAAVAGLQGKNLDRARVGIGASDYRRLRTTNAAPPC